jgi:copper oxidase (laccase) domain-containing protein
MDENQRTVRRFWVLAREHVPSVGRVLRQVFGQLSRARDRVLGIDHWKRTQFGDYSLDQNQFGGVVTQNDGTTMCTIKSVAEFASFRRLGFGTIWAPQSETLATRRLKLSR